MSLTVSDGRKRIATLWLTFAGIAFSVMIAQSMLGAFGTKSTQAWGWFLANTMPTISVVVSNLVVDARASTKIRETESVDRFYYNLTMLSSVLYLLTIMITLLGWRITQATDPIEVMSLSSIWIAPLQGIVASIISIFFKKPSGTGRGRGGKIVTVDKSG
jgi:hypothetical protein